MKLKARRACWDCACCSLMHTSLKLCTCTTAHPSFTAFPFSWLHRPAFLALTPPPLHTHRLHSLPPTTASPGLPAP